MHLAVQAAITPWHTHRCIDLRLQVGIVTLMTAREVAAEAGVPESEIDIADERVGAVVVTGSQLRYDSWKLL